MRYFLNVLIFFFFLSKVAAQQLILRAEELKGSQERPKVALVLSGGGAHGLAHVGVIKYLEEKNIPIDMVTGTSMGAIVGALYALGYTTDQMDDIVNQGNWDDILTNNVNLQELSPYEKRFHKKIPFTLRIDKNKLLLPRAIYEGYKLDQKIFEIFSPAFYMNDFSDFPRPFRCYSVDILSGKVIEHKDGSLTEAVRASMAIPSIFTPVEKDSMLLVDGGLLKNFPVLEAKAMGADVIIGSYVGSTRNKQEDVKSMADILRLTAFLTSLNDTEIQKNECDLLIEPKVKDYPILDFGYYDTFKKIGYEEAKTKEEEIDQFKAFIDQYKQTPSVPPFYLPEKVFIEDVKLERKFKVYDEIVLKNFLEIERKNIDMATLNNTFENIYATNDLEELRINLKEGVLGEVLEVGYKIKKKNTLGLSINHFANTSSSLILYAESRNLIFPLSVGRGFVRLGSNPGVSGELYKRFGNYKKTLFGIHGSINRISDPIYLNGRLVKQNRVDHFRIGTNIIFTPIRTTAIELSYAYFNRELTPDEIAITDITKYHQSLQNLTISYQYNNLDRWLYPNSGKLINAAFSVLYGNNQSVNYTNEEARNTFGVPEDVTNFRLKYSGDFYFTLVDGLVSESSIAAGIHKKPSLFDYFRVGGSQSYAGDMHPMIGINQGEFRLQEYFYLRQALRHQVSRNFYFSVVGNFLRGYTYNNVFIDVGAEQEWSNIWSVGISFGLKTILGPINIDLGFRNDSKDVDFSTGVGYRHIF